MEHISIPVELMDKHLFTANHAYAMVYLCAYRYSAQGQPVPSAARIAKLLGMKTSDVEDAIRYWTDEGFLLFKQKKTPAPSSKSATKPGEIATFIASDAQLKCLYEESQSMLGKVLSTSDMQTLFWIYDHLGLPTPVILLILNYARQHGKCNLRYVEKIAMDWADKGIDTVPKAEQFLAELERCRSYEHRIRMLFGLSGRDFTPGEKELVHDWQTKWQLPDDLIAHAYEICIDRKNKLSVKYINGILKSWVEKGIRTKQQAIAEQNTEKVKRMPQKQAKGTAFSNFSPRTDIDYKQLELDALQQNIRKAGGKTNG